MKLFEITQSKIKNMSPNDAYEYALVHGPNSDLEHIISTSAYYSYYYARNVLHGRFHEGEKAILTDYFWAQSYSKDILGRRWLKAEPSIRKNLTNWNIYKKCFNMK